MSDVDAATLAAACRAHASFALSLPYPRGIAIHGDVLALAAAFEAAVARAVTAEQALDEANRMWEADLHAAEQERDQEKQRKETALKYAGEILAERDRLREALRQIAGRNPGASAAAIAMRGIARAASERP